MLSYRMPTSDEMNAVSTYLNDLRCVFAVWSSSYEDEYDLLWFAYYEGCQEPIMADVAPYVVGNSLVKKFGFQWVMVQSDTTWHYGVSNPILPEPIDLFTLEDGDWYRPELNDELPEPGEVTLDSRNVIILSVKWKQIKGRKAAIPKGSYSQLEEQVARAQIFGKS